MSRRKRWMNRLLPVKQKLVQKFPDPRSLFSLTQLSLRCSQEIPQLFSENGGVQQADGGLRSFRDNGANVLAVAHCDWVKNGYCFSKADLHSDSLVFCPALDDRLGVYTIMDLLPALGVKVDVLLTENEESARSTAKGFKTDKKYNWMFSFDRRGTDAVVFEYRKFEDTARKFFRIGMGSFSDISLLHHLGCSGVNVGTGYHEEHTPRCHFSMNEYIAQVERFLKMFSEIGNERFEHMDSGDYYGDYYGNSWPDCTRPELHMFGGRTRYFYEPNSSQKSYSRFDEIEELDDCPSLEHMGGFEEELLCTKCYATFWDFEAVVTATSVMCPECGSEIRLVDARSNELARRDGSGKIVEILDPRP